MSGVLAGGGVDTFISAALPQSGATSRLNFSMADASPRAALTPSSDDDLGFSATDLAGVSVDSTSVVVVVSGLLLSVSVGLLSVFSVSVFGVDGRRSLVVFSEDFLKSGSGLVIVSGFFTRGSTGVFGVSEEAFSQILDVKDTQSQEN